MIQSKTFKMAAETIILLYSLFLPKTIIVNKAKTVCKKVKKGIIANIFNIKIEPKSFLPNINCIMSPANKNNTKETTNIAPPPNMASFLFILKTF